MKKIFENILYYLTIALILGLPIVGAYSCAAIRYNECRSQFSWFYCAKEFFR
ncbi:MAG: hypothetical protein SFW66_09020 [Gammaproteobacteria bacterium]|nr:hypothetical protein [Gammaproteobacteria bacterium]